MASKEKLVQDAEQLAHDLLRHQMNVSRLAWDIERVLHNLRLNAVGSSGIQHRVIKPREELLEELAKVYNVARLKAPF